jgi:hypothetical protein
MLDFDNIGRMLGGFLGGPARDIAQGADLHEILANAGLDLSMLEGLDQAQILELLQQHGLDPSALAGTDLGSLLDQSGAAETIASLLGDGNRGN